VVVQVVVEAKTAQVQELQVQAILQAHLLLVVTAHLRLLIKDLMVVLVALICLAVAVVQVLLALLVLVPVQAVMVVMVKHQLLLAQV
jgi:hypothetical protein